MELDTGWKVHQATDTSSKGKEEIIAFVGYGVEFKGVLTYKGNVRIDGQFDGEIQTDDTLLIGDHAVVTAQIRAGSVINSGHLTGDIVARECVELKSPGIVDAKLTTPKLSIENGVIFNGTISMHSIGMTETLGKAGDNMGAHVEDPNQLDDSSSTITSSEFGTEEEENLKSQQNPPKKKKWLSS